MVRRDVREAIVSLNLPIPERLCRNRHDHTHSNSQETHPRHLLIEPMDVLEDERECLECQIEDSKDHSSPEKAWQ
jgi:hypothetical protein